MAHVVGERAAAALALGLHHLDAVAVQEPDRRLVEVGPQHALGAAAQERHPAPARAGGGEAAGPVLGRAGRQRAGREVEHRGEPVADLRHLRGDAPERPAEGGAEERQAEAVRVGQHAGQHRAQEAVLRRAGIGFFDMGAGMVDEVHVVHPGRAGGHAGQAGQAAVDVLDHLRARRLAPLQHVLDQVDAPARRIELVAEQQVGRAGGGAEAAMHAGAKDLLRGRHGRIGELRGGEAGLHGVSSGGVSEDVS